MNILLGCEESQAVMVEFRKLGHNAYSCDLEPCSGNFPQFHFQMDIFKVIAGGRLKTQAGNEVTIKKWDIGIFFPPCTFLTVSANKWYKPQPKPKSGILVGKERLAARKKAIQFVKDLYNCDIERVGIENPIGVLSTEWKKPTQIIQPWMFGHGETKATCLWLKNLPRLNGFNVVEGREGRIWKMAPGKERAKERSKTYPGIAEQFAKQWSYFTSSGE